MLSVKTGVMAFAFPLSSASIGRVGGALALTLCALGPVPADAQVRRADLSPVREAMESGRVMPLGQIIQIARQTPPYDAMRFLGVVGLDAVQLRYKLKFMDGDQVVYVYVDARTGRVLGSSR
jgi:hypothetical protein